MTEEREVKTRSGKINSGVSDEHGLAKEHDLSEGNIDRGNYRSGKIIKVDAEPELSGTDRVSVELPSQLPEIAPPVLTRSRTGTQTYSVPLPTPQEFVPIAKQVHQNRVGNSLPTPPSGAEEIFESSPPLVSSTRSSRTAHPQPTHPLPFERRPLPAGFKMVIFFVIAMVSVGVVLSYGGLFNRQQAPSGQSFEALWSAGKYEDVLIAATEGNDPVAQKIIRQAAFGQLPLPNNFRSDILTFGLNSRWEKQLRPADVRSLYRYAGSGLLGSRAQTEERPETLHPGVLLAVVGNLGLQAPLGSLGEVPVSKFADLPSPFGVIFGRLNELKMTTIAEPQARSLARIVTGHDDEATVGFMVASAENENQLLEMVRLAAPFSEANKGLSPRLLTALAQYPGNIGERVRWFDQPSGAAWNSVSASAKLFLVCGIVLDEIIGLDTLTDLTQYPDPEIRKTALERIASRPAVLQINKLVQAVSIGQVSVPRPQLVSLVSLLAMPENSRDAYVAQWLQRNPSPPIVLFLIIERMGFSPNDVFNLNAAQYLAAHEADWQASYDTLRRLTEHPEALVRSLAFGRLNPEDHEQRQILTTWAAKETQPTIKEQLLERLKNKAP